MKKDNSVYYIVIFDDGDTENVICPEENDEDFEDYDNSDFEIVKKFAKTIRGSRIDKVITNVG